MNRIDPEYSFFHDLEHLAQKCPDSPALFYRERREICCKTHKQVLTEVASCQRAFRRLPQQRVGILGTNSWQWVCNTWGLLAANKTVAFLDPLLSVADLTRAIRRTDLELLVVEDELLPLAQSLQTLLPSLSLAGYHTASAHKMDLALDLSDFHNGETIFFTSGTSQNSKAVVTPMRAIVGHAKAQQALIQYEQGDVVLHPLPLHHSFGFAKLTFWYLVDCPIIISSMKSLLADVRSMRVDRMVLVPSAARFLLQKHAYPDGLKSVLISGSYLPQSLADEITALGITVQNQYGSSELPCGIGESLPGDPVNYITLHNTASVEISSEGEIIVTDPFHFKAYYGDPQSTAQTLVDGKIHTGDAGSLDNRGRLHLLGRKKNMILMDNGEKVLCQDVDTELSSLPHVADAAVIYVNRQLIAVISPEEQSSREEILASIEQYNMTQPYYRRIQQTWIYDHALPYSSSGKLSRNRLEQEYTQQINRDKPQCGSIR